MKALNLILTLCLAVAAMTASAKDLGVWGQVYPIAEPDFLTFIHQRLNELQANGDMKKMQQQFVDNVTKHSLRPNPVPGINTASKPIRFYYDPTFIATRNVYNQNGVVVVHAGTKVNPFNYVTYKTVLLFINADDPAQIDWAIREKTKYAFTKIILVEGNIVDHYKQMGRVYFDQDGVMCKKFGITQVPAIVMQSGKKLEIQEVPANQIITQKPSSIGEVAS